MATRERRRCIRTDAWFAHWMDGGEDQHTTWRLGPLGLLRCRRTPHVLGWRDLEEQQPIWTKGRTEWTLRLTWERA